ncbi:MAG: MFS transporter [Clostridiales bacterium]|nr:MFS transporter [Clostridiales bacterium]
METKAKFSGYRMAIVAAVIMSMSQGCLGTFSLFIRPISEANGFPISDTILCITFTSLTGTLLSFFAPPMVKRLKPKGCLIVAAIACGMHYWGFALAHTIWVYWFWAAFVSLTLVFGTNAITSAIIGEWFIEKRALVLGFVLGAPVLGQSGWQLLTGYLITHYGFRVAYMVMGTGLILISVSVNLLFLRMPDQLGQKPLGWEEAERQREALSGDSLTPSKDRQAASSDKPIPSSGGVTVSGDGLSVSEARKTLSYWLIFAGLTLNPIAVGGAKNNVPTYLTGEGMSVFQASGYTSLMALLSSPSSAFSGLVSQKMGNTIYIWYMHLAFLAGTAVLMLNTTQNNALLICFVLLYALAAPIASAMGPTLNSQAFGNKDYTSILTSMAPAGYIGGAIHPVVTSLILRTGGSLVYAYVAFACLNCAGLFLLTIGLHASPYVKMMKADEKRLAMENNA